MKRLSSSVVYLLISGLALAAVAVHANKLPTNIDSSEIEITNEYDNNANDKQTTDNQNGDEMTTNDQIKLLTKQLAALTEHRQEDYRMLENSIHSFIRKNAMEFADADIKRELKDLRVEIKTLRQGASTKKEKLSEWLTNSIKELRSEVSEIQATASNVSKYCHERNTIGEDIKSLRDEMKMLKLEVNALKSRQDKSEVLLRELREEITESSEDIHKTFSKHNKNKKNSIDYIQPDAEHKLRHYRLLRQQVHELELSQRSIKKDIYEMQILKFPDRVQNLEVEQNKLANANFNLSRQINNFDKLHSSMLELLEDIEEIQTKFDKTVPEIRQEITKVEIDSAQMSSDQNILKEEDHNMARTIQALAVSISTLQNERSNRHNLEIEINNLKMEMEKLKTSVAIHSHINKIENEAKHFAAGDSSLTSDDGKIDSTVELLEELEGVELQYEKIIKALPSDCTEINSTDNSLHMIAPSNQRQPILAKCMGPWTVIQKRHDGSIDFNRSWDEYSKGFGEPDGEFWIGNEMLHHLTNDNCTKLRIVMQDIYDKTWHVDYDDFRIGSRHDGYRIDLMGYSGNASNALEYQNHMKFSSIDVDLDISNSHCAGDYEGGWWFSHCQHANLNGRYNLGLTWFDLSRNEWIAVKTSIMMISKRPECLNTSGGYSSNLSIESSDSIQIFTTRMPI